MLSLNVQLKLSKRDWHFAFGTSAPIIGLEGPSGVGKSTLLRILAGLEKRAKGMILLGGEAWLDSACDLFVQPWERAVGWMPQDALCFPHLTVRQNLAFAGRTGPEEIEDIAEVLGLTPLLNRGVRNLSGGERQRVSLGRALLSRPKILLLDEPFSAVDPARRAQLAEFVRERVNEFGIRLVMVSHREDELAAIGAERWSVGDGGEMSKTILV